MENLIFLNLNVVMEKLIFFLFFLYSTFYAPNAFLMDDELPAILKEVLQGFVVPLFNSFITETYRQLIPGFLKQDPGIPW